MALSSASSSSAPTLLDEGSVAPPSLEDAPDASAPAAPPPIEEAAPAVAGVTAAAPGGPGRRRRRAAPRPVDPTESAAYLAAHRDPAQWAKVLQLTQRLGLHDPAFVDRNYATLAKADAQRQGAASAEGASPTLQTWLADPDNATLATHETAPLAQVDRGASLLSEGPLSDVGTATATGMADLGSAAGHLGAAFGLVSPRQAAAFVADQNQRAAFLRAQAPDYAQEFSAAMAEHGGALDRAVAAFGQRQAAARRSGIFDALQQFTAALTRGVPAPAHLPDGATLGETLSLIGAAAARPKGLAYQGIEGLPSMAPMLGGAAAGGVAGSVAGPIGTVAGGMVGTFAGMAPVTVGSEINAELQKRHVDITDPVALERAFSDPVFMHAVRTRAAKAGVTNAAVVSLMSGFAGKLLAGAEGGSLASKVAAGAGDVAIQAAGMGAAEAAGQAASGEPVSPGHALTTALSMLAVGGAMEGIGASRRAAFHADPIEAAAEATTHADRALRAARDAQVLAEVGAAVKAAPTTASVPERLRALVETATGGREAGQVYFQTDDWDRHWAAQGLSPAKAAAEVMGDQGKAYADAKATGAHLAIPLGDYVAHVAPTEHWDGLLTVARTTPGGLTLGEAHEYLQSLPATMRELATEATRAPAATTAPEPDGASQVGAGVESQLLAAGHGPVAAKAQGTLYESTFRALGERLGVEPKALFDRFKVEIARREQPAEAPAAGALDQPPATPGLKYAGTPEGQLRRELDEMAARAADYVAKASERDAKIKAGLPVELFQRARTPYTEAVEGWWTALTAQERRKSILAHNAIYPDRALSLGVADATDVTAMPRAMQEWLGTQYTQTRAGGRPAHEVAGLLGGAPPKAGKGTGRALVDLAAMDRDVGQLGDLLGAHAAAAQEAIAAARTALDGGDPGPALRLLEQSAEQGARGRIVFGQDGINIDLFKTADRSTFLHETGHFYLHVLDTLASESGAPDELKIDRATVRQWLGADSEAPFTRAQHEQFARGFEAYLMEGKAPSTALRAVFQRFKSWLTTIYQHLTALHVELSPEIRGVMDRLVASREAIARAEHEQSVSPLFGDPRAVGMSETEAAKYEQAARDAHESAEEALTAAMMQSLRREESAEWAAWRDPIEKDVAAQVANSKVSRALTELTASFKIDREAAKALLGPDAVRQLPKGVTATEGGVHPDVAAELLGFSSGQDLLAQLAHTPPDKVLIRHLTDERMQAEHGARMSDAEVAAKASEVVHGEKRARLLRMELEHLATQDLPAFKGLVRAIAKAVPPTAEVQVHARDIIGATTVRDLRPDRFEQAAARQAKAAQEALLAGDVAGAFAAKRQELLATEVFNEATRAKAELAAALDTFKKVFRRDERLAPTRDLELVNAARSVLASFGIGTSDKPASHYLEQVRQYDPETADTMQALVDSAIGSAGGAKDYRTMPLDDFRALADAVGGLWTLARTTRQLTVDGVKLDRRQVQAELVARIHEIAPAVARLGAHEAPTKADELRAGLLSLRAVSTKIEHWVRAMDGGASDGLFRRYLWNRISEAATTFRARKTEEVAAYAAHLESLRDAMPVSRAKIPAPELGYTFRGHNELLGALLHTGNESNLAKNLIGRGWAEVREDGSVDTSRWDQFLARARKEGTLTKAHYDWAQDVWDRLEALKPDAQRAHRQLYGRYFAEITATPFANEFGSYRGGYYPAKADRAIVPDAEARADRDTLLGENTSFLFPPSVGKGFTISRVEGYRKPLTMDASAVPQHIDAVLRFTHLGPAVREVARVVTSPEVREALHGMDSGIVSDALVPWLQRAGQQRAEMPVMGGRFWTRMNDVARVVRNNAALQIMAANSTVLLEQLTHFPSVLVRVPAGHLASALWGYMTHHAEVARTIREASPFMATRESAALDAARSALDRILLDPSVVETVGDYSRAHGRFLMTAVQSVMDHAVWSAAFDQGMETMGSAEAVRHADATVRELLGSYAPEDVSRIEAGTPIQRLFTMFYGFFNTKANVLHTELSIAKQVGLPESKGRIAGALLWGLMVPAMMGLGIKHAMAGKGVLDQQDDEGTLHALAAFLGEATLEMGGRMIPYGGSALVAAEKAFHKGRPDDLLNSPAVKMVGDAVAAPGHLAQGISAHEVTAKQITDVFTLIGLVSGLPARPVGRAIGYVHDVHTGRAGPRSGAAYARGVLTGH